MKTSKQYFNPLSFFLSRFAFIGTHIDFVLWLIFIFNNPLNFSSTYLPFKLPTLDFPLEEVKPAETCSALIVPNLLNNLFFFAIWCLTHSGFARDAYKRAVGIIDHPLERPTFAAIATVLWFVQIVTWKPISDCERWNLAATPLANWILSALIICCGFLLIVGLLWTMPDHVFGTSKYLYPRGEFPNQPVVKSSFPYGVVRHPVASGFLYIYLALPSYTRNHLLLAGLWSSYILLGTTFEELGISDPKTDFGREYLKYRKQVNRYIPNWNSLMVVLGVKKYKED